MPLDPRNIVADGPDVMSQLILAASLGIGAEASPIYETIDASVTVSGTCTDGDIEYVYSGTTSIPQLTRIVLRDYISGVAIANYEIERENDASSYADIGIFSGVGVSEFIAILGNVMGCNGGVPPFSPPRFEPTTILDENLTGTRIDNSVDPPEESPFAISLTLTLPYFIGTIADSNLELLTDLTVSDGVGGGFFTASTDASAWTSPDFRDIRGTYGATSYDVNGIEYVWSVTIG